MRHDRGFYYLGFCGSMFFMSTGIRDMLLSNLTHRFIPFRSTFESMNIENVLYKFILAIPNLYFVILELCIYLHMICEPSTCVALIFVDFILIKKLIACKLSADRLQKKP